MEERIRQMIEYYGTTPNMLERKIFVSEGTIYKFLSGKIGMKVTTLVKILENFPDISPDWLILGKGEMLRENYQKTPVRSFSTDEDTPMPLASELPAPYRTTHVHHSPASDGCPWERYDAAQQEIGSLRERLSRASVTIATLQQQLTTEKEKTPSASATTDTVVTLV